MSQPEEKKRNNLLRPCTACKGQREVLSRLNSAMRGMEVIGVEQVEDNEEWRSRHGVAIGGPFSIRCRQCKNTGFVLTLRAQRLLGLVKLWLEDAHSEWANITDDQIEQEDSIPF